MDPLRMTRRSYLMTKAMELDESLGIWLASEAVASTALEHPEWDMTEKKTWDEWEASSQPPVRPNLEETVARWKARSDTDPTWRTDYS